MVHDNHQVEICVSISKEVVSSEPRRAPILRIMYLEICRQILEESVEVFIMLSYRRIKCPGS
jgi:hypothetical protein